MTPQPEVNTPLDDLVIGDAPLTTSQSLLSHLADRREVIVQRNYKDVKVPRWSNPEIFVRYKPVPFHVVDAARKAAAKDKGSAEAILLANCDALIEGCLGVFATIEGEVDSEGNLREFSLRPGKPESDLTRFDADLAEALGMSNPAQCTARQVVRRLFYTDGDIIGHGGTLAEFSGFAIEQAEVDLGEV